MDHPQYSFDLCQQVIQGDSSGYHGQLFLSDFEDADGYSDNLDFAIQAPLPQSVPSWNQTSSMQRFLKDTQRAPLFNPLPQQFITPNAQPVESLPPVASRPRQDSPFSSQDLSSCSSTRSPCADTELFTDQMPSTPPSMVMFDSLLASSVESSEPQSPFFLSAMGGIPTGYHNCMSVTELNAINENTNDWNTSHHVIDFSSPTRSYTFGSHAAIPHHNVTSRHTSVDRKYKHAPSPALSTIVKKEINVLDQLPFAVKMSGCYPTPSVGESDESEAEIDVASLASDNNDYDDDAVDDDDEDDNDDDYQPHSNTSTSGSVRRAPRNKRDAPKSLEKSSPKRARTGSFAAAQSVRPLPPSSSGSKELFICAECSHSFKDEMTLKSHVKKQHTRPFICVFRFAGCASTFASKNEWKRHVMSQHLVLHYWLCDIAECASNSNSLTKAKPGRRSKAARRAAEQTISLEPVGPPLPDGAIFNRKDLYTQHVRRMHTPVTVQKAVKAAKKSSASSSAAATAEWDAQVKALQTSALHERCQLPTSMLCPAPRCMHKFSGTDAWDQRMEHVARHLEQAALGLEEPVVFGGPTDPSLMNWVTSADVAVVRSVGPGRWVLNNPLRAASEGRGVGRKREVALPFLSLGATAASSLAGSSTAVSFSVEPSPSIQNEILVEAGDEDAEGEEE